MATRTASLPNTINRLFAESLAEQSDRKLLDRFEESGDEVAFTTLVDRHGPMILGQCRRLVGSADLAEDVFQATFLLLARKSRSIRNRDSLAGWLYRVARSLARQVRLTESARSRREITAASQRGETVPADAAWDELLRILDEELQRLPERDRAPLLLCYLEGRTQDEAAKHLGWSLSTLRRRLETGRELLRSRMTHRGATLGAGLFAGLLAPSACAALTPILRQSVVSSAVSGGQAGAVSALASELVKGAMRMTALTKIGKCVAFALVVSGALAGVVWGVGFAREPEAPPAQKKSAPPIEPPVEARQKEPIVEPEIRRDLFNDRLPDGATARLGTVSFRHGRSNWRRSLVYTTDGKQLVTTGGGWVRRWDLDTGSAIVTIGDGGRSSGEAGFEAVNADGKIARITANFLLPTRGVVNECTEYDLKSGKERTYRIDFPSDGGAHSMPNIQSPDGKTSAEISYDGTIALWNAVNGKVIHSFKPSGAAYSAIAFPLNGKTVLIGDQEHVIRVFNLATGAEERIFSRTNGNVIALMAVSPDGKWLVTAAGEKGTNPPIWPRDRFLRVWNLEEGKETRTLEFPEDGGARSLLFSPDSRTIIAGMVGNENGSRAAVRTWDVATGKPGRALTDDVSIGLDIAVSPDGKELATLSGEGVIRFWDMTTGKERRAIEACPCAQKAVSFLADGKTVVTVGADFAIRQWDGATGKLLGPARTLAGGDTLAYGDSMRFSADKLSMVTYGRGKNAGSAQLHDLVSGKLLIESPGYWSVVTPDGKRLATMSDDRRIRILDIETGKELQAWNLPKGDQKALQPHPVAFASDGHSLIVQGETLSVWNVRTGKEKSAWNLHDNKVLDKPRDPKAHSWERIKTVALSPDGSTIAFSILKDREDKKRNHSWYGRLMILETATGKVLHQEDIEKESYETMAFSPNGKFLAGGTAWSIRIWNVATGKAVAQFEGHRAPIKSVAFSPDSGRLASASEDSTVLIWNVPK